MPATCKHLRPIGLCLRCAKVPNILDVSDPRLVPVLSSGKTQHVHWILQLAFQDLNAAFVADTGLSSLKVGSGHRLKRWPGRTAYNAELLRRYRHRCPPGSSNAVIIAYGKRRLAYNSLHYTGCAIDLRCHGLTINSSRNEHMKKLEVYKWLKSNAKPPWINYVYECWHWEYFIPPSVWALMGPDTAVMI